MNIFEKVYLDTKLKKFILNKKNEYFLKLNNKYRKIYLRNNSTDKDTLYSIFSKESYEINNKYFDNNKDIKLIVDLGANIGMSVLYFHIFFPNAKIIAIEPDKKITKCY